MPYSSLEGKDVVLRWLREMQPRSVLDVGAGSGTYAKLIAAAELDPVVFGIEIHEPYADVFGLFGKYSGGMVIGDALTDWVGLDSSGQYERRVTRNMPGTDNIPRADVVILGDVVEHLSLEDAGRLWDRAWASARTAVVLSIPIGEYPQGPENGNQHEAHLTTWDRDMVHGKLVGRCHHGVGSKITVDWVRGDVVDVLRVWKPGTVPAEVTEL